jgi:triacylglycerol lipase
MKLRRILASALAFVLGTTVLVAGAATAAEAAPAQSADRNPVIIVGGTGTGQPIASIFYRPLRHRLQSDGYEAFIFGPPNFGLGDIADAAQALDDFAAGVMARTGSTTVDLVGHSQGGLIGRHYIRFLGGEAHVDNMISLGAPHHGTSVANLLNLLGLGNCLGVTACEQMTRGSDYLAALNAGDESWGDVQYTNIATRYDEIVNPWRTAFLADDVNNVNVDVQGHCWARLVGHITLATDGAVYSGIRQALAGRSINLNCWAV